jgi:hypothetical protein
MPRARRRRRKSKKALEINKRNYPLGGHPGGFIALADYCTTVRDPLYIHFSRDLGLP